MASNWGDYLVYNAHSWSSSNQLLDDIFNYYTIV